MDRAIGELAGLPPHERAVCYRQFAKQAEDWAERVQSAGNPIGFWQSNGMCRPIKSTEMTPRM